MEFLKSVEEAAESLGLSPWTIRLYVRQRRINVVRIGRRVLIEPCEIQRLIEEGRENRKPAQTLEGPAMS